MANPSAEEILKQVEREAEAELNAKSSEEVQIEDMQSSVKLVQACILLVIVGVLVYVLFDMYMPLAFIFVFTIGASLGSIVSLNDAKQLLKEKLKGGE